MDKIKIAIVDDELTARNAIKSYLEDSAAYEVVVDFANGKSALEWFRKNDIDILLCDMLMPEMDGVELIRSIHIINEFLPVIAISSFDDFDYVRGSLVNGVADYLLKHELSKKALISVLDQVRERYRIIPEGREVYQQTGYCIEDETIFTAQKLGQLIANGTIDFGTTNILPIALSPDYKIVPGINSGEYKHDLVKAIIDILNQILREKYCYIIYVTKESHLLILLSFADAYSTLFMINAMNNLVGRLQRRIIRMLDITATIVTGEICRDITNAIAEAKEIDELLVDKLYLGGNRLVSSAVAKKLTYSTEGIPVALWEQFNYELSSNIRHAIDSLQDIFDYMEERRLAKNKVIENCQRIVKDMRAVDYLDETEYQVVIERLGAYEIFEQYRGEIMELINRKVKENDNTKKQYSAAVKQAMEYIYSNFTKDISLEECAELTGSSYTYLSSEFKKETGMRFVEFLNQQRVSKAKSLLIRRKDSMKEIVELSGFRDYNYFFKVFKEIVGVTPREFVAKKME